MLRALAVLMLALVLAGCADAPVAPAAPPGPDPDASFVAAMVPHHQQALELTAMVGGRGTSPGLAAIALRIDRAQVEEIGQMQGLARARALPASMAHHMPGMADAATLDRLRTLQGPAFERLWLEVMTRHHEGAVAMARDYLAVGTDDTLRRFAQVTDVSQSDEIATMTRLRTSIAGS